MGIYIKGATKDELENWLYSHGVIWDTRDLVDIPEPHGRLIDADVLENIFESDSEYLINEMEHAKKEPSKYTDNFLMSVSNQLASLGMAIINVYDAPTVIERSNNNDIE